MEPIGIALSKCYKIRENIQRLEEDPESRYQKERFRKAHKDLSDIIEFLTLNDVLSKKAYALANTFRR